MIITKRLAKEKLGLKTDAALARFFEIGRWAVGQWRNDKPLPKSRQWELRAKLPGLFGNKEAAEMPRPVRDGCAAKRNRGT